MKRNQLCCGIRLRLADDVELPAEPSRPRLGNSDLREAFAGTRQIFRGELLEVNVGFPGSLRVVDVPGDRGQMKNGRLLRNGAAISEPYRDLDLGSDGDFPLFAVPQG